MLSVISIQFIDYLSLFMIFRIQFYTGPYYIIMILLLNLIYLGHSIHLKLKYSSYLFYEFYNYLLNPKYLFQEKAQSKNASMKKMYNPALFVEQEKLETDHSEIFLIPCLFIRLVIDSLCF